MRTSFWLFFASWLVVGLCLYLNYHDTGVSDEALSQQISSHLEQEFTRIDKEAEWIRQDPANQSRWEALSHAFYWIENGTITNWNKADVFPDLRLLEGNKETQYLQWPRGSYLSRRWSIDSSTYLLCVVPLNLSHKITNRYLEPDWNRSVLGAARLNLMDPGSAYGVPVTVGGNVMFKVTWPEGEEHNRYTSVIFYFGWVSLLLFLAGLWMLVRSVHRKGKFFYAFLLLLSGVLLARFLMTVFAFPRTFTQLLVFDPLQFASSALSPSIADLFLNSIFILALAGYLFYVYPKFSILRKEFHARYAGWIIPAPFLLLSLLSLVYQFLFIETIFHNSSISLDITQSIELDPVRMLAMTSVLISSVTGFLFSHTFFQMGIHWIGRDRVKYFVLLAVSGMALFMYYKLAGHDYFISLATGFCYFSILFLTHAFKSVRKYSFVTFLYLFLAVSAFSVQGAFSIKRFVEEELGESRFRFANAALIGRDILGEYLLRESRDQISGDPFIQVGFTSPFITRASMRQKIRQVLISSYFDRYDIQLQFYSSIGQSLDGEDDMATELRKAQKEANTQHPGIYLIKGSSEGSGKQYLVVVPVERAGVPVGFVLLSLSLKKVIPQSVYPELLVDNRFSSYLDNKDFSYAFYGNMKLEVTQGEFNYEKDFNPGLLSDATLYKQGIWSNGYFHSGVEDDEGNIAVVSSPAYPNFSVLTNFSFLFTSGLILVCMILALTFLIIWKRDEKPSYSARIQFYVYLAFLLPLVAVSVTTVGLIANSAKGRLQLEFLERSKAVGLKLGDEMARLTVDSTGTAGDFEAHLVSQAKLASLDASVFSSTGRLIASSQPQIFRDQLVSNLMNRTAWIKIVKEKEDSYIADESIGKLRFSNSYVPLKSSLSGELTGILSVPFFDSEHSLERQQISVMANILVIFTVIFILFSVISFFAVRWLTFPLQLITKSLSLTTLTGTNKPLQWKSDDEIGLMVKEYNRMVENLERSKHELARVQKESAWREIAKQIAHEIKNPLTPMRLTLQRMEQIINSGELTNETAGKSVQMLLTQVEILNDIASSFSAFARMPAPILEKLEVNSLLQKVMDLHSSQPMGECVLLPSPDTGILGDEQLLIRVFSNIMLNAWQSVDGNRTVRIEIGHTANDGFCTIRFADNGMGIEPELRDKVFLPHFSTKKSGSGLGLAIAKQGVEQGGGAIWFDSVPGKGTTFFIRIPLAV